MFKESTLSIYLILLLVSACGQNSQSGFDIVCDHFDALDKHPNLSNMSKEERFKFIDDLVEKGIPKEDYGYISWDLLNTPPEEKYSIFSTAAQEVTGKPWSCPSMEKLAPTIEEGGFI